MVHIGSEYVGHMLGFSTGTTLRYKWDLKSFHILNLLREK